MLQKQKRKAKPPQPLTAFTASREENLYLQICSKIYVCSKPSGSDTPPYACTHLFSGRRRVGGPVGLRGCTLHGGRGGVVQNTRHLENQNEATRKRNRHMHTHEHDDTRHEKQPTCVTDMEHTRHRHRHGTHPTSTPTSTDVDMDDERNKVRERGPNRKSNNFFVFVFPTPPPPRQHEGHEGHEWMNG